MERYCANCATAEEREDNSLFCPIQEEPAGPEDSCGDWQSKLKAGKTCADCGNITEDPECETGFRCYFTAYECARSQPACNDYTVPVESEIDESESLTGKDIDEEAPYSGATTDFNLYEFKNFQHEMGVALLEVYNYIAKGGGGDPKINILLTGFMDKVKASIVVDLPHKIKMTVGSVETVRENGTFRIVLPDQPDMFDDTPENDTEPEQTTLDCENPVESPDGLEPGNAEEVESSETEQVEDATS